MSKQHTNAKSDWGFASTLILSTVPISAALRADKQSSSGLLFGHLFVIL